MKGSFQQSKYISVLSKPLESHGSFILSKSTGLYWRQLEPFLSEIYITDSYVSQRTKGGDKKKYSKKEQPILQSISHIFLSIWNNDMKQLESIFDIKVIDSKTSWEFHLTPKDPSVKKYIASIYIKGNEYISSVTINENNHDYTVIKVTSVSGAEILNDDEINLIKGL
ncbi:MAG: outer membrane lipoprotein carrier protein LolA [Candidatus Brocadiales bacterium]|nr:outer membrane lipoprotein carrier protein LolA [Candidatus Brocadiales bacterium]